MRKNSFDVLLFRPHVLRHASGHETGIGRENLDTTSQWAIDSFNFPGYSADDLCSSAGQLRSASSQLNSTRPAPARRRVQPSSTQTLQHKEQSHAPPGSITRRGMLRFYGVFPLSASECLQYMRSQWMEGQSCSKASGLRAEDPLQLLQASWPGRSTDRSICLSVLHDSWSA